LQANPHKPACPPLPLRRAISLAPSWVALVAASLTLACAPGASGPGMTAGSGGMSGVGSGGGSGSGGGGPTGSGGRGVPGSGGTGGPITGSGGGSGATGGAGGVPGAAGGDVTFSVPSQTFRDRLSVRMTTNVAGAEIRYTTNGQLPSASSTLHGGSPLDLTATTQLRAQAFVGGAPAGRVRTALYICRTFDFTSSLPIVIVDGYGGGKPMDKDVYKDAAVMFFEPASGTASVANIPTVASRAGYHVRGQSSANFPQTPYKIELWDDTNADLDYPVLGMPSDSDWALIAPYYDRALVRNPFVYELGREMGLQAPRTRFAEVYINYAGRALAETDYQGIYWVTETIKNNKVRTNLKQLDETETVLPEISGGYIFKFDQAAAEQPILTCTGSPMLGGRGGGGMTGTCWRDLEVVDPDPLIDPQKTWLTQHIQTFHDSLHATPIGNYATYIDLPSFVDYLLVNELTRNVDAYVRSAFYHKDRDGKIKAGPLWDYNFALAVGGSGTIDPMGGWQFAGTRNVNNWYQKLTAQPSFMDMVKARWKSLRGNLMSQAALDQRITDLIAPLAGAPIAHDYAKWPVSTVYANTGIVRGPTVATFEGQVQALRTYIAARLTWMDAQLQ
jgi:hypothetical protein